MKIIRRILKYFIVIIIIAVAVVSTFYIKKGYDMYNVAISDTSLTEKIEEIKQRDNYTKISEVPKIYLKAVIAVEDHRFYEHPGIDVIAICRAAINDIKARSFVEGGSTITQQLAKNIYFTQDKKIERKVAEVFMAFEIEKNYKKDEILEFYINTTFFGNGYYTVKEASRAYFNKEPLEMTDGEAVMLAGIPNAPSLYNPINSMELAKQRQRQVVSKMKKYGGLPESEADRIINEF